MVISQKYNFIFLRVPKNASTSLATFFVNNCCHDPDDIFTQIGDSKVGFKNVPQSVISKYRKQYRIIHLTLNEIISEGLLSEERARRIEKIAVLRNPLERQLSLFFFLNRNRGDTSPSRFRREFADGFHYNDATNKVLQTDFMKIGKERVGDFWLYDNLSSSLTDFCSRKKINVVDDLKTFKSKIKPSKNKLVEEYYDKATLRAVEEYYKDDFEEYWRLVDGKNT